MLSKPGIRTRDDFLREILSNGKRYFVPKFQRDYSWDREHWEDLWEDIHLMEEYDYHYMGYLVIQEEDKNFFKIIDGQQRLTTFSLLVLAAIQRLKNMEGQEDREVELKRNFIGTKNMETLVVKNKLQLNKNNNYYYERAVEGKDIQRIGKETVHLMAKAMIFFYDKLKNKSGEEIGKLIEKTSNNLLFTTIYINDELSGYKVFETLNARGVQLSSGDLLKNYLFTLIDYRDDLPDTVITEIENKWSEIGNNIGDKSYTQYLLDEWNSYNKLVRKTMLFKNIRNEIKTRQEAEDYLDRLESNSVLYNALNNSEEKFWKDHQDYIQIKADLGFLTLFNIKQPISLLLSSYHKQPTHFSKILKWIKILSLRYNVIGGGYANEQEKLYNEISLKIRKNCGIDEIKRRLLCLYPDDNKFKLNFIDKKMPAQHSNKRSCYLLARLEEKKSGGSIDETSLTLEHILPLNPNDQWCDEFGDNWQVFNQRLGNMALVNNKENQSLGQKSFLEKKQMLSKTAYDINNIDDYNEWSSQTIASRQKRMANLAAQLWRIDD